ncbi:hypothetical protein VP01_5202g1 [Puccinia sorghi]|uniref:Uncharacterized protein n=1 Tax=Puccinia sorghi TaxID=27349 RepID=A0A0L6UKP9_9BASI|nr:hypothetical protein VP01_5202g1 [Puccinia sorghi]
MDVDEEIFKIANTPLSTLDPSSQSFQPENKVRFQNPSSKEEIPFTPKEKPARNTYLEKPVTKEYPRAEEETISTCQLLSSSQPEPSSSNHQLTGSNQPFIVKVICCQTWKMCLLSFHLIKIL